MKVLEERESWGWIPAISEKMRRIHFRIVEMMNNPNKIAPTKVKVETMANPSTVTPRTATKMAAIGSISIITPL